MSETLDTVKLTRAVESAAVATSVRLHDGTEVRRDLSATLAARDRAIEEVRVAKRGRLYVRLGLRRADR